MLQRYRDRTQEHSGQFYTYRASYDPLGLTHEELGVQFPVTPTKDFKHGN